jgi:hypothetical protein
MAAWPRSAVSASLWVRRCCRSYRFDNLQHINILELQAVLDPGYRLLVPLVELRDRHAWQPGWQRLPQEQAPPDVPEVAEPIQPQSLKSSHSTMDL